MFKCMHDNESCILYGTFVLDLELDNILYLSIMVIYTLFAEYFLKLNLKYVRIYFDTPSFERITKDRSKILGDQLSAIGGTMAWGFSQDSLSSVGWK